MQGLTATQRKIVDFIHDYTRQNGFPPSYREIGKYMGYSAKTCSGVETNLLFIETKGYIQMEWGVKRSLTLTQKGKDLYAPSYFVPTITLTMDQRNPFTVNWDRIS